MEKNKSVGIEIPILYEDKNCLFINKPAGLSVHGDGKTPEYTIADWIIENYPKLKDIGEPLTLKIRGEELTIPKPGMMHRLDKETSGVLLIAKTQKAYDFFKTQFQDRLIKKIYHCFVYGWVKEDSQTIDRPIGRSGGDIRKWVADNSARGVLREAVTEISVLQRFGNKVYDGKGSTDEGVYSFVEARPKTGRTHQIRVHLRYINHPIVSDSLYAPKRSEALGFERLALHARELEVELPTGKILKVEAPYPKDFKNALTLAKA